MAITRAQVEIILISRIGTLLTQCKMDGTTKTGANADLTEPMRWSLTLMDSAPASVVAVTDADLSGVADGEYDKLLDLCEYRALEIASTRLDAADEVHGQREKQFHDLARHVINLVAGKAAQIASKYGIVVGAVKKATMQVYG